MSVRFPSFLTSSLHSTLAGVSQPILSSPSAISVSSLRRAKHREGTGSYPLEQRIRRSRSFFSFFLIARGNDRKQRAERRLGEGGSRGRAFLRTPAPAPEGIDLEEALAGETHCECLSPFSPLAPGGVIGKEPAPSLQEGLP